MISRHVPHKLKNDSYRHLARYIADASHRGEKALMSWCSGCWSGDDEYELGLEEAVIVQSLNTRTSKEKTYHLVVSFRPEDEAKLAPEIFKEIEMEFAKALGFEEHQRHAGVHQNTNNLHLHVAYSMIHPTRHTRHEPYRDFQKRDRLCRTLEQKYGLAIDNGRDPSQAKGTTNTAAQGFEAHTGQESFFSYAQRHKPDIMTALAQAKDWGDIHQLMACFGLGIKPHGNGLVIHDLGKHSIKASDLDRALSKPKLVARLGQFEGPAPSLLATSKHRTSYTAAPLQKSPDRDNLYTQYQQATQERQAALEAIKQQDSRLFANLHDKWEKTWQGIKALPMVRRHRQEVMKQFYEKRNAELKALRQQMAEKRDDVRAKYPFKSWVTFLQHQAAQGHETALAILRSKTKEAPANRPNGHTPNATQRKATTPEVVTQITELLRRQSPGLTIKPPPYTIDKKGTIIIKLPGGGILRDTGTALHFSGNNEKDQNLANGLALIGAPNLADFDRGCFKPSNRPDDLTIGKNRPLLSR